MDGIAVGLDEIRPRVNDRIQPWPRLVRLSMDSTRPRLGRQRRSTAANYVRAAVARVLRRKACEKRKRMAKITMESAAAQPKRYIPKAALYT